MSNVDPVLARTWQFNLNNIIIGGTAQAGGLDDAPEFRKNLILAIKNAMIGFATLPWTVAGSASFDTGAGAMDAVDRWGSIVDIRWRDNTALQRSWIVLENATLGMQFLFDCVTSNNTDGAFANCYITPLATPFTGGSSTARPTSAAETQILSAFDFATFGSWGSGVEDNQNKSYVLNVWHSEDGLATRVIITLGGSGTPIGFWQFERIEDPVGAMTNQWLARVRSADPNGSSPTINHLYDNARTKGFSNAGAGVDYFLAAPTNDLQGQNWIESVPVKNPYDGRTSLAEVGVASESLGHVGFHGVLRDLYWVSSGYNGRGLPASTNAWMQFGDFAFPWDGSIPIIT